MKWSILILTQPSRAEYLKRLLKVLQPQVAAVQGVDIEIRYCDFNMSVGDNRQIMREGCAGEYSNFIDDDDLVPEDYVAKVLPLMDGVDYIGYNLQRVDNGSPTGVYVHSLDNGEISHINPIKTSVALEATMYGGFGEDRRWWDKLKELNAVQTQNYLNEIMYFYLYRSDKNDGPPKDQYWIN